VAHQLEQFDGIASVDFRGITRRSSHSRAAEISGDPATVRRHSRHQREQPTLEIASRVRLLGIVSTSGAGRGR
jgi:hypothetical protein